MERTSYNGYLDQGADVATGLQRALKIVPALEISRSPSREKVILTFINSPLLPQLQFIPFCFCSKWFLGPRQAIKLPHAKLFKDNESGPKWVLTADFQGPIRTPLPHNCTTNSVH
jgi:hypothetical protein